MQCTQASTEPAPTIEDHVPALHIKQASTEVAAIVSDQKPGVQSMQIVALGPDHAPA
jgi:hypothetical protein